MPSASRSGFVVLAALGALAGCSSGAPVPHTCAADADCPASSRCLASACVANAAPVPTVVVPTGPLETNVLVSFDGSGSADADPDDSIVSYGWSFRAVAAGCAPPAVAGTDAIATVRFACPGRWAVDLTVTDEMPASATTSREFEVVGYSGPALVTASADLALEHVCTALPTRCTPEGEIVLSAAAPGFAPGDVSFEWSVEPPANRPLDEHRRVRFSPDALVPSPTVTLETDGQAISGDWVFRVHVRDAAGLLGSAATRVSVGNRPPVIEKSLPAVEHLFAGGEFTAEGEIPFSVSDPDGDAVLGPSVELRHAGDGDATFSGALATGPDRVTFRIAVPYSTPEDALHLIGGVGLERAVAFTTTDVNGAQAAEVWPIVVGNRPPALGAVPAAFTVEHGYDPVALEYRAEAPLSTWTDPDGDPLFQVPSIGTGDPRCPTIRVDDGAGARLATVSCTLAFSGAPAVANFAGAHAVTQAIQDPWTRAAQTSTVTFTIANRAPTIDPAAGEYVVSETCALSGGCCGGIPGECLQFYRTAPAGTALVPSRWLDLDGDPLSVVVTPSAGITAVQPLVCTPSTCTLVLDLPQVQICGTSRTLLSTSITDGLGSASGTLEVARGCR